ncbi:UNKNOWN [Stylonychia lemnae]|uniref:Uncharacterized protein n=1 Tax=Stylonychia lemnae TaxID=5949 RepID=A0A078A3A8_STYLE|nr:UNKNOWN [Stylonychia lemnae]|eukprot:CDW76302.1 UNKNOWN [Stylonychia lemnae]
MNMSHAVDRFINISKPGSFFSNFANHTYIVAVPKKGYTTSTLRFYYSLKPNMYDLVLPRSNLYAQVVGIIQSENQSAETILIACMVGMVISLALIGMLIYMVATKIIRERQAQKQQKYFNQRNDDETPKEFMDEQPSDYEQIKLNVDVVQQNLPEQQASIIPKSSVKNGKKKGKFRGKKKQQLKISQIDQNMNHEQEQQLQAGQINLNDSRTKFTIEQIIQEIKLNDTMGINESNQQIIDEITNLPSSSGLEEQLKHDNSDSKEIIQQQDNQKTMNNTIFGKTKRKKKKLKTQSSTPQVKEIVSSQWDNPNKDNFEVVPQPSLYLAHSITNQRDMNW